MNKDVVFAFASMLLLSMFSSNLKIMQFGATSSTQVQSISPESDSKCGTMMILESLNRNQKMLGVETQSESTVTSLRPTDPGGGIDNEQHLLPQLYNSTHFVLHWTNGTDGGSSVDAVSLQDLNTNGVPDFVESSGTIFEEVWNFEISTRGFPAPPSDLNESNDPDQRNPDGKYDVFIYNMVYYGYAMPEQWPNSPSQSFVAIENDFRGFNIQGLDAVGVIGAHEFFHAIQFVFDCTEENWWMETTATYMEDEVFPNVNRNYLCLPAWFTHCDDYGLTSNEEGSLHSYGNFIFAKRLSEDFGDNIIKEIWTEMAGASGLSAISNVLIRNNSTLLDEFSKFITSNFFLEDMYVDGADYRVAVTGNTTFNGVWLKYQYDASAAPFRLEINNSNVNWGAWMDKWAAGYITIKLDPGKTRYRISFDGLDLTTNYLAKLVTKKSGIIRETVFNLDQEKNGYLDLSYDTFDNMTLIIANAGNTDSVKPSWKATIEVVETLPTYDVAISDLKISTLSAHPGQTINLTNTVRNNGNTRNESFNVSTWWGDFLIETQPVIELPPGNGKVLNISWTVPFELNGSGMIWSEASLVPGETNVENNRLENGRLVIAIGVHDLAVTDIRISETIVGQGSSLNLSITTENQGDYTEVFNLTTYVNDAVIQEQTLTLQSNTSETIVLLWSTAEFPLGECVLSAYVEPVPNETDTADNNFTGKPIILTIRGDINGDFTVDILDAIILAGSLNSQPGSPRWNPNADLNGDDIIDIYDAIILANNYGKSA
jgi:hypothetical protein